VTDIHDQIATALAAALGFDYRKRFSHGGTDHYTWSKENTNCESPPIPGYRNPCGDIPMAYELCITIHGSTLTIHDPAISYDLNDPNLLPNLLEATKDLNLLRQRIKAAAYMAKPWIM
jgi:hypothetical protein